MSDELQVNESQHSRSSDWLSSLIWALILLWAGGVFLASNLGLLTFLPEHGRILAFDFIRPGAWTLVFLGAGAIVLVEATVRLVVPAYRHTFGGSLIFAAILFGLGLGNIFSWEVIWPLVLIAIGISVLVGAVVRKS